MIIKMLIVIAILVGIYFYMQKSQVVEKDDIASPNKLNFYPSDKFDGAMTGYIFKMDDKGLGYYLDNKY